MLGAKVLMLTNASGGINLDFNVGDLMLITGKLAALCPRPLSAPTLMSWVRGSRI
jgi:purine-nucleoside phosphorylase